MILEFKVNGFCSFAEKQGLSLIGAKGTRIKNTKYEDNFYFNDDKRIMKSAIIFGSNASGKTNLILAMESLLNILKNGLNLPKEFPLQDLNHHSKHIEFEISILSKNCNFYTYNVKFNKENIIEESFKNRDNSIFEFQNNKLKFGMVEDLLNKEQIESAFSMKSTDTIIKKIKDFSLKDVNEFLNSIEDILIVRDGFFNFEAKEARGDISEEGKVILEQEQEKVINILQLLDYSIDSLHFEKLGEHDKKKLYQIYFKRGLSQKKFYLGSESEGIKKIMYLMHKILDVYAGKTLIVDELDSSISTNSLIKIYNDIINSKDNEKGQLIVTSHNIFLFNNNIFNTQQIYVVNKNENINSELYSIDEFDIRTEKENLYIDYLKGRFGGING